MEGELEIGQIAGLIHEIKSAESIVADMMEEYQLAKKAIAHFL